MLNSSYLPPQRDRLIAQMDKELEQWDVWLCPVAMTPAFTHRPRGEAVVIDGRKVPYLMASGAYTIPFSFTGRLLERSLTHVGADGRSYPGGDVQVTCRRSTQPLDLSPSVEA